MTGFRHYWLKLYPFEKECSAFTMVGAILVCILLIDAVSIWHLADIYWLNRESL